LLFASATLSFLLLLARTIYTGRFAFWFLVWNLFLAFLPLLFSEYMSRRSQNANYPGWKLLVLGIVWMLFIPNSFYMITDLFHLYDSSLMPIWFQLLLIFCFTWTAIIMGILSIRQVEEILRMKFKSRFPATIYPIMFLIALGIYVGRFMRYNSWDVVTNPFALVEDIINLFFHPLQYRAAWAMVACFSCLFYVIYHSFRTLARVLR